MTPYFILLRNERNHIQYSSLVYSQKSAQSQPKDRG